jgi:hypothetical protein
MNVIDFVGKSKLKYEDIRDLILSKEVHKRNSNEATSSGYALDLETKVRGKDRNSGRNKSKYGKQTRMLELWQN